MERSPFDGREYHMPDSDLPDNAYEYEGSAEPEVVHLLAACGEVLSLEVRGKIAELLGSGVEDIGVALGFVYEDLLEQGWDPEKTDAYLQGKRILE